jgi:ribonuclease P protein component
MFKKSERLNRPEFTHFFSVGTKKHYKHLTLITAPSPTRKVAVVVGKKVAKSAVKRNTIRRRILATLRQGLEKKTPSVFIVIVKPTFATLTKKEAAETTIEMIAQAVKST